MKELGYTLFGTVYNICRIFPVNSHKIVLWNGQSHGLNGNLAAIYQKMRQTNSDYKFFILSKRDLFYSEELNKNKKYTKFQALFRFFFVLPYQMATAEKIFLNDNFLPLNKMKTQKRKSQFIQLWHGAGAFKKFGLSTEKDKKVHQLVAGANKKITHLFVTSQQVLPFYEEAFQIDQARIYSTGVPVTDLYFDETRKQKRMQRFYKKYPQWKKKKILLYAPTFRASEEENKQILQHFDVERVHQTLGEEWVILIKMHPKFPQDCMVENDYCVNMTTYGDISDLYLIADVMITDYSSTVVEYVLLDKPVLFFAYDYQKYDRGFYIDYKKMVPGPIAFTMDDVVKIISKKEFYPEKRHTFVEFQYDNIDNHATERILTILEKKNE